MYQTDWIAEFRQKLAAQNHVPCSQEDAREEEASPIVKRWLRLADQFLRTGSGDAEPA
jgi:hypothetical protein